jgi:hypothetical protein
MHLKVGCQLPYKVQRGRRSPKEERLQKTNSVEFLTGRPQVVKVGNNTSTSLILNTGAPQGCMNSPLLYSLFTHDCVAKHASNSIIKFADNTTVVSLIANNDEPTGRR